MWSHIHICEATFINVKLAQIGDGMRMHVL